MPNHVDTLFHKNNGLQRHGFYKCNPVSADSMRSTFFSPLSAGGSSLWRSHPSAASILLDASIFSACASGPFLRCFKASLSQFSGNSFFLLLLVSFRWDLKFHYLGPFSHTTLLASSEPPSLLCASGMTWAPPFPQAQRALIGCVAGAEELAPLLSRQQASVNALELS